jgi:glucan phosphoethanolaminetransferase (alkaline phosphatase superfamily)
MQHLHGLAKFSPSVSITFLPNSNRIFPFAMVSGLQSTINSNQSEGGIRSMQHVKSLAILAAIILVLLACTTTHVMSNVAGVFSIASVIVFAAVSLFGVVTRLRI